MKSIYDLIIAVSKDDCSGFIETEWNLYSLRCYRVDELILDYNGNLDSGLL